MNVVVINSGSSSIKYEVFDAADFSALSSGLLERIGDAGCRHTHRVRGHLPEISQRVRQVKAADHEEALNVILTAPLGFRVVENPDDILGIGHRVVHGGEAFRAPVIIDDRVIQTIRDLIPLAPLHNPANLLGIEAARKVFPGVPHVAVFDTAFHQSLPPHAFVYPLPYTFYTRHHVRRYGFHGTSHRCVAAKAAAYLGKPLEAVRLITLHLGNGASAAAIRNGMSVDTSMGMTPLEGLVMGTRCGDLDPAIPFYLRRAAGMSEDEVLSLLNRESGLKGLCGANDMREVLWMADRGEPLARLAVEITCYRIKKYIGAYVAVLGRVDALVFTGGIGENAAPIRRQCCEGLEGLGIGVDDSRNGGAMAEVTEIQRDPGLVKVLVIRTEEGREIAEQTLAAIRRSRERGRGGA